MLGGIMKKTVVLMACLLVAGCVQATGEAGSPAGARVEASAQKAGAVRTPRSKAELAAACAEAANKAAQSQAQAEIVGSALSMAGGFGGYAGRGGLIAAQAASVGGSVLQAQASTEARTAMADCYD
jgi:hypothetical protein